mmetsp:Transcript_8084/g.19033  ORF Transcript_8084/g.19033 Transcript_8084/m.19033 type:complete len:273 (+) Transcript_8084:639-1457(+)
MFDTSARSSATVHQSTPPVTTCRSKSSVFGSDPNCLAACSSGMVPSETPSATAVQSDTAKPNMTMSSSATDQISERALATMDSIMIRSSRKNLSTRTIRMMRANFRMRMTRRMAMLEGASVRWIKLMTSSAAVHETMTKSKMFQCRSSPFQKLRPKPTNRRTSSPTKSQQKMPPMTVTPSDSSCIGLLAASSACTPRKITLSTISTHIIKSNLPDSTTRRTCRLTRASKPSSSVLSAHRCAEVLLRGAEDSCKQFFSPKWKAACVDSITWPN